MTSEKMVIRLLMALLVGLGASTDSEGQSRFPRATWDTIAQPEEYAWSVQRLDRALAYADTIGSEAILIVQDGAILRDWGATDRRYKVMSIRKSLLSALLGIEVGKGGVSLESTLEGLGIDDVEPSLTDAERQARVVDLVTSRSGVYHQAAYETPGMQRRRPERGSYEPGTYWFYSNWDFNALGTIFERTAGTTIFEAFDNWIARPLGMEDFRLEDTERIQEPASEHAVYLFKLSARDLARFGLLFLRRGYWNGEEIVPEGWVEESTRPHVDNGMFGGYGYMWWVALNGEHYPFVRMPDGTFSARGTGEQNLVIIPSLDLVIVHLTDVDRPAPRTHVTDFGRLLQRILAARGEDL